MTISLMITLMIIFFLSMIVIRMTIVHRDRIPCMMGMMIAMTLGMSVGLTVGLILGILISEMFLSTITAMIVGVAAGFIAGVSVSLMSVLDGILAGLMGGMMGSMLGQMISPDYSDAIIKIMFIFFVGVILILIYMMYEELKKNRNPFFGHPIFLILIFSLIFFGYHQLGPTVSETVPDEQKHQMDMEEMGH